MNVPASEFATEGLGSRRNLLLRLAYDGTAYFGWQIQPGRPTIQGVLTETFERITGEPVQLHGAGRTDAGVHACAQAANVALRAPIPCANLVQALNDHLPESIRVLSAQDVAPEFHARRQARSKVYRYRIYREKICPPWLARYVYPFPYPLDEDAMRRAAREFVGEKDFGSFASADGAARAADSEEKRSTVRTVLSSVLERVGQELIYTVEGSGFLNHMVRNVVGTLIEVGRGNIAAGGIAMILAAHDRSAAGPTAPARGLHLICVRYPDIPEEGHAPNLAEWMQRMR
ncbi:MAG: tRNA pseudouridine(38-40) synthase TruA [Acidobacteria bacterium]|nr:tRNA pseudouridine(38-40) synthase TruA [Acidobacteriota bacterium]